IHGGEAPDPRQGYEYFVVDRILQKQFGDVNPQQMVAICHWALQSLSPGRHLFLLVEALQEEGASLPPAPEVYDFCRALTLSGDYPEVARNLCDELVARAEGHRKVNP